MRKLLEPLKVGNMELRNRVILSAMAKYFCTNGFIGQEYIEYYRTIAHGGTALITPGIMCVEPKWYGQHEQPFLNDDKYIPGLKAAIDAVHGEGAKFSCQLWMPGHLPYTQADYIETNGPKLVAVNYMSREMIQEMQQKYVDAAIRCAKAGTDAIEWHMAHNYLPEQFYSPYFNHRTDEYGAQNVDNAMRFSLEIIDRIRKACPNVEVVAKMNGTDCHDGEASMAWLGSAASLLEQHGVSLITVNGGGGLTRLEGMSGDGHRPEGWKVKYAEIVKNAVSIPVAASGNLKHPSYVDAIISEGKCDLVALGRTSICDPHWVNKCKAGREDLIRYCLSCMHCVYALPADVCGCTMNPRCRREAFTPRVEDTPQTGAGRKVVVVGAGPAGCLAAITLAQRSFRPILCDKNDFLGGMMVPAGMPIGKQEFQNGINYYANMLRELKVDVRLNTEVTPELLQAEAPYAVIAAVGSYEFIPPIPGADGENVIGARRYILERPEIRGKKVVVLGCGQTGLEAAHMLAALGNDVTEIEMQERAFIMLLEHKLDLEYAEASGVKTVFGHKVLELTDSAVVAQSVETGEQVTFAADVIIPAIGVRSNSAEVEKLRACGVEKFFNIGDSAKTGMIYEAISAAYDCAIALE